MKKLSLSLFFCLFFCLACNTESGDDGGSHTNSSKIATIEEQATNINSTIATLNSTRNEIKNLIANASPKTRAEGNNGIRTIIAALEERVEALEVLTANLQNYTEEELASMGDWTEATYATMEQYNALATELATIKATIEGINEFSTTSLEKAITTSVQSMNCWVNEQLTGYYSIAEIDAQIAALQEEFATSDQEIEESIASLSSLKSDVEVSYKQAISDAILLNNGLISSTISDAISNINNYIKSELDIINSRLEEIEERLNQIEESIKNLMEQIQSINYISTTDGTHQIFTLPTETTTTLRFRISSNNTVQTITNLSSYWNKFLSVQAHDWGGVEYFITLPIKSFDINDEENGIFSIIVDCEELPNEALTGFEPIGLSLKISDGNSNIISDDIKAEAVRWFCDKITETPAANEIYYCTSNTLPINLSNTEGFSEAVQIYNKEKGYFVITLPNELKSFTAKGTFDGRQGGNGEFLSNIAFPNGLTEIGLQAIYECKNLTDVLLPESLTIIGPYAFHGCSNLTSINIPYGITEIGQQAFQSCSKLTSINFPDGLTKIGEQAFNSCRNITDINIPESVTEIGAEAFKGCNITFTLNEFPTKFQMSGILSNNTSQIILPSQIITEIPQNAFSNCTALKEFNIPETVTKIGAEAFSGCNKLTSITIPQDVTEIGERTFAGCSSLTRIDIPQNVTKIGERAFSGCSSLTSITIPDSVTEIGKSAFSNCTSLTHVTIPDGVTSIEKDAFYYCSSLTSLYIPNSVTAIGEDAFYYCSSLKSIIIPQNVTSIGGFAFHGCKSLTDCIFIPNGKITEIKSFTFNLCSNLTKIDIPEGVTTIENNAFQGCPLTQITFPQSLKNIGHLGAMIKMESGTTGNSAETAIGFKSIEPPVLTALQDFPYSPLVNIADKIKIFVPTAAVDNYKTAKGWSLYADYIVGYDF